MLTRQVYVFVYKHGKHARVTTLAMTMVGNVRIENNSQVLSIREKKLHRR